MGILLDTSVYDDILKYKKLGIVRGVTTNPAILRKENNIEDKKSMKKLLGDIAKLINPYPLSIQINNLNREGIIEEAQELANISPNVIVKVPIHGPNGEMEYLEIINILETQYDIRVNATSIMSAQQCLVAGMAGANYVSIFAGRVNDMGYSSIEEVRQAKAIFSKHNIKAKIIGASCRETVNLIDWLKAGADFVTLNPNFLGKAIVHPYTKETVKMLYGIA